MIMMIIIMMMMIMIMMQGMELGCCCNHLARFGREVEQSRTEFTGLVIFGRAP